MSTPGAGAGAGVPQPLTVDTLMRFTFSMLRHVVAPEVLATSLKAAATELGWADEPSIAALLPPVADADAGTASGKKSQKKAGADAAADDKKKERAPRSIGVFAVYQALAMDRMGKNPEHPAYKIPLMADDNGLVKEMRGAKLVMCGALWAGLGEERKEQFSAFFKPLCDALNEETTRNHAKLDNISGRVLEYKAGLSEDVQDSIEDMLDSATEHLLRNRANILHLDSSGMAIRKSDREAQPKPLAPSVPAPTPATGAPKPAAAAAPAVDMSKAGKQASKPAPSTAKPVLQAVSSPAPKPAQPVQLPAVVHATPVKATADAEANATASQASKEHKKRKKSAEEKAERKKKKKKEKKLKEQQQPVQNDDDDDDEDDD